MKTAIKNIPEKIYLNLGFDKDKLIEDIDFEELWQSGEITWCRDKINDTDIEYYASQKQVSMEKIIKESHNRYPDDNEGIPDSHTYSFCTGAEWMINQINK